MKLIKLLSHSVVKALAVAGALILGATVPAHAAVVTIDDVAESFPIVVTSTCGVLAASFTPETVRLECSYNAFSPGSTTQPRLPPGQGTSLFFNIYDPGGVVLSDTLVISFLGTTPDGGNFSSNFNMRVDVTFVSDTEGVTLQPLVPPSNGFNVIETGAFQSLDSLIEGTIPSSGFSLSFLSDVERIPEPSTITMLGLALAGLAAVRRRSRVRIGNSTA